MSNKPRAKQRPKPERFNSSEPASFDVEGFLGNFKPAIVEGKVYQRADLLPRLTILRDEVKQLNEKVVAEVAFDETDELSAKVIEFQNLQQEYLDGGFRTLAFLPKDKDSEIAARVAFQTSKHKRGPKDQRDYWATLSLMAEMCVEPKGITPDALHQLYCNIGDAGMVDVTRAWLTAFSGGGQPDAPFSPVPSPTPGTPEQ
jgi:hypothetical protein